MHDRLLDSPESFRATPSTHGLTAFSVLVLVVASALVAGLAWLTLRAEGFVAWALVGTGWLVVLACLGRPSRVPDEGVTLQREQFPWLHQLVDEAAQAVGVRSPDVLGVDLDFNAHVASVGLRGRRLLVLGLPLWALETPDERLGTLCHELGHFRGGDTARSRLATTAGSVVARLHWLVHPGQDLWIGQRDTWTDPDDDELVGTLKPVATALQGILAMPLALVLLVMSRLEARSRQHSEYLADRRAAAVSGTGALVSSLRLDMVGIHTAVRSAVLRGEEPFGFLSSRQASAGVRHRVSATNTAHRADASHPPDHLRIGLLENVPVAATRKPASGIVDGAEREMRVLGEQLSKRFADDLRVNWF